MSESDIMGLFDRKEINKGFESGCYYASTIMFARALIEALNPEEWDAFYPLQYEKQVGGSKEN